MAARLLSVWLTLSVLTVGATRADDLEPDLDTIQPGLVASFEPTSGPTPAHPAVRQVVTHLRHDWAEHAPDSRLPNSGFHARFDGWLLIQTPGEHRFFARTEGKIELWINQQILIQGAERVSEPIALRPGLVPIQLISEHEAGPSRLAIDWAGPGFDREPLPSWLLYHVPDDAEVIDRFEEGRRLADRLGCANCHEVLDLPRHPDLGPSLKEVGHSVDSGWLRAWLADPSGLRPGTTMPAFGHPLPPRDVADLAAFLEADAAKPPRPSVEAAMAQNVADAAQGRLLFRSSGCLGCHTRGEVPGVPGGLRPAPDLSDLARKRTIEGLTLFLGGPSRNAPGRHRPELNLTPDASAHLAAYLVSDPPPALPQAWPEGDADRGRTLAESFRCASCHQVPGIEPMRPELPLRAGSDPEGGCLAETVATGLPRFALSDDQRRALRSFVAGLPLEPTPTPLWTHAQDSLRRRNCLGCHTRDGQGGAWLGRQVAHYLNEDSALNGLKGTLTPPDLSAVGDKLRLEYLEQAIRGQGPTARPWLSSRMPRYAFEPGEAEAIVAYLVGHDRSAFGEADNANEAEAEPEPIDQTDEERAVTLLGREGFGCVSCHVLGGKIPPGGEPETMGPDLALAHDRMPKAYFQRWLANPQRILPGTAMPQFIEPVATVSGTLDDQLETIWNALRSDRVGDIASFGTREILQRQGDRALLIRDMVLVPDAPSVYYPRALAIGLKNDFSLLFDADRLAWVAWWRDGFAYRTKAGRLWEWHPEGQALWTTSELTPPLVLLQDNGEIVAPTEVRERFGSFRESRFEADGIDLHYDLNFEGHNSLVVSEQIRPTASGWTRRVRVEGVPKGARPLLLEPSPEGSEPLPNQAGWAWTTGPGRVEVRSIKSEPTEVEGWLEHVPNRRAVPMEFIDESVFSVFMKILISTDK